MISRYRILLIIFLLILTVAGGTYTYRLYRSFLTLPEEETLTEEGEEEPFPFDHFDILLLGLDGRDGLNDRTDTIILLSIDTVQKKGRLLSIPRDTRVQLRPGSYDKINAAYVYGGVDLAKQATGDLLKTHIDRFAAINFDGVVDLVNILGGVEVDVPVRMYVPLEGIDLQAGPGQLLNGADALAYMRYRGTSGGDMDRIVRQQEVLVKLAKNLFTLKNILNIRRFLETALDKMDTDLTISELAALASISSVIVENGIETYVLPGVNRIVDSLWYFLPDLDTFRNDLAQKELPSTASGR